MTKSTDIKISIIIPVFNGEKYLSECIDSVIMQTLEDIEIICINDGSEDRSFEILKEYKEKDYRIIVIDQENQGVSAARNAGLKIAQGKYVGFVDGDDTIEDVFFEKLIDNAEKAKSDVVYSKFSKSQNFQVFPQIMDKADWQTFVLPIFFKEDALNAIWNKIYRNEIIQKNNITFPVGTQHGEDAQFNIEFLMKAQRISFLNYCGYHYREVEGSATRNIAKHDYLKRMVEVYETDWTSIIGIAIDQVRMENLKKIRFANAVISLVYVYGNRGNDFTDAQRFSKLRAIVQHPTVKKVFSEPQIMAELKLGKYSAAIFRNIRKRNVLILFLLTQYSYYRNK